MPRKEKTDEEKPTETAVTLFQPNTALKRLDPKLQEALSKYRTRESIGVAPQWKPENPGDFIVGSVTNVRVVDTDFGESTIVTFETTDGPKAVFLSADLKIKLGHAQPGQAYVVQFDGWMRKSTNGNLRNDMKIYTVIEVLPD